MPRNLTGNTTRTAVADAEARAARWADPKVCARALLTPAGYSGVDDSPPRNWGDPPAPSPPADPALAAKLAQLKACAEALISRRPWVIGPSRRIWRRIVAANVQEGADSSALPAGWQRIGLGYDAAGNPVDPAKAARWADPKVCAQALLGRDSAGPYVPPMKRALAGLGFNKDGACFSGDAERGANWADPQVCARALLSPGSSPPSPQSPPSIDADALERGWNSDLHPRGGYPQNRGWFSRVFRRGGLLAQRRARAAATTPTPQANRGQRSNSTGSPPSGGSNARNMPAMSAPNDERFVEQPASNVPRVSLVSHTGAPPTNFIHVHQHLIREINGKKYLYFQREKGGDWYVVELTRKPIIDKRRNVVVDTMTGAPKMTIDVTGAKKVDAITAFGLNHPSDTGWVAIAKKYAKDYAPIDPDSLSEDMAKSGEVAIPLVRYAAKSFGAGVAGVVGSKFLGKTVGKVISRVWPGHHPLPKYLGGAVKQTLAKMPRKLHEKFHASLDKWLKNKHSRIRGSRYFKDMDPQEVISDLRKFYETADGGAYRKYLPDFERGVRESGF